MKQCIRPWITTCPKKKKCPQDQDWCESTQACYFPIGGFCPNCNDGQRWCYKPAQCYFPIGGYCEDKTGSYDDSIDNDEVDEIPFDLYTTDSIDETDVIHGLPLSTDSTDDEAADNNPGGRLLKLVTTPPYNPTNNQLVTDINIIIEKSSIKLAVIAVINGHGFDVSLSCQFRVITVDIDTDDTQFYYMNVRITCQGFIKTARVRFQKTDQLIFDLQFIEWVETD